MTIKYFGWNHKKSSIIQTKRIFLPLFFLFNLFYPPFFFAKQPQKKRDIVNNGSIFTLVLPLYILQKDEKFISFGSNLNHLFGGLLVICNAFFDPYSIPLIPVPPKNPLTPIWLPFILGVRVWRCFTLPPPLLFGGILLRLRNKGVQV